MGTGKNKTGPFCRLGWAQDPRNLISAKTVPAVSKSDDAGPQPCFQ